MLIFPSATRRVGFFYGRAGGGTPTQDRVLGGDGHASLDTKSMKATEDANFLFRFSFITTSQGKGFVTHYRPKHPPLSSEMNSVFQNLGVARVSRMPRI